MLAVIVLGMLMLPDAVGDLMPSHVGDTWVYETEIRDGNRQHPDVEKWQEEVTTVAVQKVADGVLIERRVRLLDGTGPTRSAANWHATANILVRGSCLYFEHSGVVSGLADVCFPLRMGMIWGDPKQYREHWQVAGFDRQLGWRLVAHLASGDDNSVWFQKKVGLVAERTFHNGSYYERRVRLVRCSAGK